MSLDTFDALALEVFQYQYANNAIYRSFIEHIGINPINVTMLTQIPFMPISFFKRHAIQTGSWKPEKIYESSGTTGTTTSRHLVRDNQFYLELTERIFRLFYGSLDQYHFLFLLPSYLERGTSSLITMANHFVQRSDSEHSGFYLHNYDELINKIEFLKQSSSKKIFLWGVTYALLDVAEQYSPDLSTVIVLETGGMKGRRKELTRGELHEKLKKKFNVTEIHSEYGMTELMSQAYSKGDGKFFTPPWMKIILRDAHDPFDLQEINKSGGINVIDLGNVFSCAFIETQDLGLSDQQGIMEIHGRFDNSDIRGCNLLV
ncbi:acyl transferase [Fulvivirga sp. M361]|nr:acyl transferase [Fulvivirga sp. M361]